MPSQSDTFVALSTPPGESALAVVRASGPACPTLACEILKRRSPPPWRHATFGCYYDSFGNQLDEGILVLYEPGKSFTGDAMLEFTPHGNPLLVSRILDDLVSRGCRLAEPGEFSRTAFLNGRMDLSQAEAVIDLIQARSDVAMEHARRQVQGSVGVLVGRLSQELLGILARLEAYIDFPEEDLPPEDQGGPLSDLQALADSLQRLIQNSRYKALLDNGIRTLIVGPPNAGKSSLINLLVGEERALVSEEPGTTRDYIREAFTLEEQRIQIVDTAGIREKSPDLETRGIQKTLELMQAADFFLLVVEAHRPFPRLPESAIEALRPENTLVVQNKTDLGDPTPLPDGFAHYPRCPLSIKAGNGYAEFREIWLRLLRSRNFTPPPDAVILNSRHAAAMMTAMSEIQSGRDKLRAGEETLLACSDLRRALDALGEVIGKVDNEAMLDILFREFCIGK